MRTAIIAAIALASTTADPPRFVTQTMPAEYTLVTQTYAGRIDIRKGLTAAECEHDRFKALNMPADDEERAYSKRFVDEDQAMTTSEVKACGDVATMICLLKSMVAHQAYLITSQDIRHAICEKQP